MRWALVKVAVAVTTMVVLAFAVPLGLVVKEMARDRAFTAAERQAAALGPVLAITTDEAALRRAAAITEAGYEGRIAVHVPDAPSIGEQHTSRADLDTARRLGRASTVPVEGGFALLQPVALDTDRVTVVEVFVSNADVTRGVATAWLILGWVGLAVVVGSVAIADRLGTRMVVPARLLARAARTLGKGDLSVRVPEEGPSELRAAAVAFNTMADRVVQLLANERELAADLSHRLRTPLTVLRLNAASLGEGPVAEQTRHAVSQLEREVDQIIKAARNQSPGPGPGTGGCDAAEVVRERMAFWSALAEDQGRAASMAGVDQPAPVPVPRAELAAALDALLGNVFRHTPEGTAFAVDMHVGEESVILLLSDAGPGIEDPDAAMRRGHGAGGEGSTGLGLDIVRRVAESTGGGVSVGRSVLGGAEFQVWLQQGPRMEPEPRRMRRDRRSRRGERLTTVHEA